MCIRDSALTTTIQLGLAEKAHCGAAGPDAESGSLADNPHPQPGHRARAPKMGSALPLTIYPQIPRHSWTNSRSSFRRIFFSRMRNLERETIIFTTRTLDYLLWKSLIEDLPNEINPTLSYRLRSYFFIALRRGGEVVSSNKGRYFDEGPQIF